VQEVHRFANDAGRQNGSLLWDILRILAEIGARSIAVTVPIESVGVDTWGVDYALLGENGNLLENPYHYRDTRTEGMMDAVFERVSRERIYSITGIQFLPINTLFQLYAACVLTPRLVDASRALVTIPDLLNYWLTGSLSSEYTVATTTQFIDARTRSWATRMLDEIGLPTRLLQPLVEPGSIVGRLVDNASPRLRGTPVIAPACHDTRLPSRRWPPARTPRS
jgi:sugar (pentulose or hexulose) kinase